MYVLVLVVMKFMGSPSLDVQGNLINIYIFRRRSTFIVGKKHGKASRKASLPSLNAESHLQVGLGDRDCNNRLDFGSNRMM